MNWEAIGAIGELVSAFAVVGTLAYLAVQIRAQNRESRMSGMHDISAAFRDNIATYSDPVKADIYVRGNENFDSLSDAERFSLIAGNQSILRVWEEAFHQHREDRLDQHIWDVMVKQYASVLSAQSFARVWELRKEYYDPSFRDFVDDLQKTGYRTK